MVSIQLEESVAAQLMDQASAQGLSLEAYLGSLAGHKTLPRLTGEELERLIEEASVAGPSPSCSYTRADIYLDHD